MPQIGRSQRLQLLLRGRGDPQCSDQPCRALRRRAQAGFGSTLRAGYDQIAGIEQIEYPFIVV